MVRICIKKVTPFFEKDFAYPKHYIYFYIAYYINVFIDHKIIKYLKKYKNNCDWGL